MSEKKDAAHPARPSWNKDEWAAKAKERDAEYAERAKDAEAALAQGKRPRHKMEDVPKPTKALEARSEDLDLNKNLNKTMLVQTTTTGQGPRGAGFYCEMCNRTFKDSLSYLDHVNGRTHLAKLGQTTQVQRSTLAQVRAKIASLRAATATKVTAKNYDFQERLRSVRENEKDERSRRREEKKRKRAERREAEELGRIGVIVHSTAEDGERKGELPVGKDGKVDPKARARQEREQKRRKKEEDEMISKAQKDNDDMAAMMGFGGFGGAKKR